MSVTKLWKSFQADWRKARPALLAITEYFCALNMDYFKCIYFICGLLNLTVIPRTFCEMYTSLLNVKQAIDVERKLISYLETYINNELERLEDVKK